MAVLGYKNRLNPLEAPQNEAVCPPDMLRETAITAGRRGLDVLQEEVALPDSRYPDVVALTPPDDTPAKAKPVEKAGDVVVTVTPPENVTPHIGDIFYVLKKREIRDPTTGKVIETREQGFCNTESSGSVRQNRRLCSCYTSRQSKFSANYARDEGEILSKNTCE